MERLVEQPRDGKLCHVWCERNKKPILEVLRRVLPAAATVLEVGSGSGQHAVFLSKHLPGMAWQPSDIDKKNMRSIRAWIRESDETNVLDPIRLDVVDGPWPSGRFDAVFSANLIHISPWRCSLGLLEGAHACLAQRGLLILYGPFRIGGSHTADSNASFDEDLRGRNSEWGVRDLEAVVDAAIGFELLDRIEMPANNQVVILRKNTHAVEA